MYIVIIVSVVILASTALIWLDPLKENKIPTGMFEWIMTIMSIIILLSVMVMVMVMVKGV